MYNKFMLDIWNYLKNQNRPIVLYGMGNGADKVLSALNNYSLKISGVFASDSFVRQKTYNGFLITDYKTAKEQFKDMIVLLCFGSALPEVISNIKRIKSETELYAPDVPVCGGPFFNAEFYEQNAEKIQAARELLSDNTSRRCFDNIIKYKLTGEIEYLFNCETKAEEIYNIICIEKTDIFVDLGAYRGDTVLDFIKRAKNYKHIIAAEPDIKTFNKLKKATEGIKNITLINAAAYSQNKAVAFNRQSSRGSTVSETEKGEALIPAFSLDSLSLKGENIYIKADIEGAESEFIKGAENTISTHHPKMRIAAYHKSADIFEIPLLVHKLNPNYKIYLRHTPCLPAWDTDYFFI